MGVWVGARRRAESDGCKRFSRAEASGAWKASVGRTVWAARKRFLLGFVPRDRAEENKTSCPEREEKRNKKKKIKPNIPRLKAYLSPLAPTIAAPCPRRSRARAAINAGARSRETSATFHRRASAIYTLRGGGGCVLQFLPCQPSILERMKQPWRIRAVQLTSRAGLRIPAGVGFSAPA